MIEWQNTTQFKLVVQFKWTPKPFNIFLFLGSSLKLCYFKLRFIKLGTLLFLALSKDRQHVLTNDGKSAKQITDDIKISKRLRNEQ